MQSTRQSRIPEQQGIGQTLPPVPVGIDAANAPPLPPGAMPAGTRLQVGKYQVIVHNFIAEGKTCSRCKPTLFSYINFFLNRWFCSCIHCSY